MAMRMDTDVWLAREIDRIADEFEGTFSRETIGRYVRESLDALEGSRVKDYVPIFVARFARERLKALAQADGIQTKAQPEVLFVCVHNAGRSQMAAGWLRHLAGDAVEVRSAGSVPGDRINPSAVEAMAEVDIDITDQRPTVLTTEAVEASDVVITMGCGDACPVFPGKRYLDWELTDPAGRGVDEIRPIRDEIDVRVRALLAELRVAPAV